MRSNKIFASYKTSPAVRYNLFSPSSEKGFPLPSGLKLQTVCYYKNKKDEKSKLFSEISKRSFNQKGIILKIKALRIH